MTFEVISSHVDGDSKVVEIIPRRHNEQKSWQTKEVLTYKWFITECYDYTVKGKATPKTGADYKREIEADLEEIAHPKAYSPTEQRET